MLVSPFGTVLLDGLRLIHMVFKKEKKKFCFSFSLRIFQYFKYIVFRTAFNSIYINHV